MRLTPILWFVLASVCGIGQVAAQGPKDHGTGVIVQVGNAQIEVAAVTQTEFRLSIALAGKAAPKPSVFLAKDLRQSTVAWTPRHEGEWQGIQTRGGAVLVDTVTGAWELSDGHTILARSPKLPAADTDAHAGMAMLVWKIETPKDMRAMRHADRPVEYFGSGDVDAPALVHTRGESGVDNGHASVPYYWSTIGYSVFVVGENDNRPARWYADTTADSSRASTTWQVDGRSADIYLSTAPTLEASTENYVALTGRPPVPPRWAFGYMQSRWGWVDRAYIEATQQHFLEDKLPVDAFIIDFEWYTKRPDYDLPPAGASDYHDFSWNPDLFPDPAQNIAALHATGIHFVVIRKPRLGNAATLTEDRKKGWILPGSGFESRDLDFANPAVRKWYASELAPLLRAGIDGWWDDEGELTYTEYIYWAMAERAALDQVNPRARLWTLDRAFQPGLQRLGSATWTGDIYATWPTLAATPGWLENWSLAGMFYGTCDIGGHNHEDTPEILTRWMEAGVFFPVMRTHSYIKVAPRFPWLYGTAAEDAIRKALDLRYRLIPMYYSLAHEAYETGAPMMRPLVIEFPNDPVVDTMTSQWMMGTGLMAAPVLADSVQRQVYFPAGGWYTFGTNQRIEGPTTQHVSAQLDEIPVYVRAGTILPLGPVIQHTDDLPGGPLEVQVYPGKDATFTLVEDDGRSTDYTKGVVRRTTFTWNDAKRQLRWKVEGSYAGKDVFKEMRVVLFGPAGQKTKTRALARGGVVQFM